MKIENRPSNLHRRRACPGSGRMEAAIGPVDDETEFAAEGTLLHRHFADKGLDRSVLTTAQQTLLEHADTAEAEAFRRVEAAEGLEGVAHSDHREQALTFTDPDGMADLFTGTADLIRVYHRNPIVIVIQDLKTGFLEVDAAADSDQLCAYSIMAFAEEGDPTATVYCAINQPRASRDNRLTLACYSPTAIIEAWNSLCDVVSASLALRAPLSPSEDACRYCRARFECPESVGAVLSLRDQPPRPLVSTMADDDLKRLAEIVKMAKSDTFGGLILKELKLRIKDGRIDDWELKSNGANRELTSVKEAFGLFAEAFSSSVRYLSPENDISDDFLECLEPRWGKLEALVAKLTGLSGPKAKKKLLETLWQITTHVPKEPSPSKK